MSGNPVCFNILRIRSLLIIVSLMVAGFHPVASMAEIKTESPVIFSKSVDEGRKVVSQGLQSFVDSVDEFFGSERVLEESKGSYFKLSTKDVFEEGGKSIMKGNLYAKVSLPRTEDRFKLLIASDADVEDPETTAKPSALESEAEQETTQSAALRYVVRESADWNIHTDAGIRFRGGIDPFVRYRVRRSIPIGLWTFHFAETLFWFDSEGVGARTHVDFTRPIALDYTFRTTTEATWYHDQQSFDLLQSLELLHRISDRRSVIYRASAYGNTEPNTHVTATLVNIRLRQAIHRDWVYFEIKPQIDYLKETGFAADKTLTFQIDIIF
jgi:hypothetical protein